MSQQVWIVARVTSTDQLVAVRARARGGQPRMCVTAPDEVLVSAVEDLEAVQRALDSARLALVGELDARSEPERRCGLTHRRAGWVTSSRGLAPLRGVASPPRASCGHGCPLVESALREGRVTLAHAELLARLCHTRVEHVVIDCQDTLIALAVGVRFEQWARRGPRPHRSRRHLTAPNPAPSTTVWRWVTGCRASSTSTSPSSATVPPRCGRRCWPSWNAATAPTAASPTWTRTMSPRHGHSCWPKRSSNSSAAGTPPEPEPGHPSPMSPSWSRHRTRSTRRPRTGCRSPDGTTRLLCCDAAVTPVIVDANRVPLDMGTAVRFFTPAQRRAILVRDGGCAFPGCDAPLAWTQIHHLDEAADQGPTDLANGIALCPIDHAKLHTGNWHIEPDPDTDDHGVVFISPTGRRLPSQRHGRPRPPNQTERTTRRPPAAARAGSSARRTGGKRSATFDHAARPVPSGRTGSSVTDEGAQGQVSMGRAEQVDRRRALTLGVGTLATLGVASCSSEDEPAAASTSTTSARATDRDPTRRAPPSRPTPRRHFARSPPNGGATNWTTPRSPPN